MNLVGKILVTLIFVMTSVYLGFAVSVYSTHKNWRDKATALSTKIAQLKTELQNTQAKSLAELETLQAQIKEQKDSVDKLKTARDTLLQEIEDSKEQFAAKEKDLREATSLATAAVANVEAADKKVDQLRTDLQKLREEKDEKFRQYVQLLDDRNNLQADRRRLDDTNVKLTEQLTKAKVVLERRGLSVETDVSNEPPKMDGIVLAVANDGLMEISLGTDDGLNRGHTLEVTRGTQYLGRVQVVDARPEKAVAKALPQFQKGKIERNDRVATRIN